jgi:4-amino-4-deoxy-L-arabinose transferase-like glycosyltransferase
MIVVVALVLRIGFLLAIGPLSAPDTLQYKLLAHNVLATGEFAHADPTTGEWVPYAFRMPLYQYLLAGIFAVCGETDATDRIIVVVQAFLSAATAGLVSLLGAITAGRAAGVLAGLFFALDPLSVLHTAYILTDTLFVFLTTSAVLAGVWALRSRIQTAFLMWGLLIGAATLTRPLFKYYAIVPIATLVFSRTSMRMTVRHGLACLLGIALILGPWAVRNKVRLDFWGLELNQGLNMVWSTFRLTQPSSPAERLANPNLATVRDIVANASGPATLLDDVKKQLRVPEVVADRYLQQIGWENIARYPVAALKLALRNATRVLTSPVTEQELIERFGLLNRAWLTFELRAAMIASFLIYCVGALWGFRILWRNTDNRPWLICFALTCIYVVGLTSPVAGYDRYRLPIEGILWVLFTACVLELRCAAVTARRAAIPRA